MPSPGFVRFALAAAMGGSVALVLLACDDKAPPEPPATTPRPAQAPASAVVSATVKAAKVIGSAMLSASPTPPLASASAGGRDDDDPGGDAPPFAPSDPAPAVSVDLSKVKCPKGMAPIAGKVGCIDVYEASAGKGALGQANGQGTTVVALSEKGKKPLTKVTLAQAEKACKNAKKHLCTHDEWQWACRGGPYVQGTLPYAYGGVYEPGRCRDWDSSDHGLAGASETGSSARCVNQQGVFDLNGNVGELTAGEPTSGRLVVRGGTYNMTRYDSSCDVKAYKIAIDGSGPDIGFRCCADALK